MLHSLGAQVLTYRCLRTGLAVDSTDELALSTAAGFSKSVLSVHVLARAARYVRKRAREKFLPLRSVAEDIS